MKRSAERRAGARQARRPRDDGGVRSRSDPHLRFRRERTGIRRPAAALRRPVFRAPDAAPDQRARRRRPTTARSIHVDMRLRPSGRSGPVATMLGSFESYQENEAWTWEHMALTRARVVSGPPAFAARVEQVDPRCAVPRRAMPRRSRAMSSRCARAIATEKGDDERWDLKYAAGGLVDLEFIAQYLQLVHARRAAGHSRYRDRARARQGCAAWRAAAGGGRRAAAGGAALSGPDADPAALPLGTVRSESGRAGTAQAAGARRRRAGFRHARGASDRDAGARARELRADRREARRSVSEPSASAGSSVSSGTSMQSTGSRTSTIVPTPSVERMRIAPPCSSASDFAIARPRPEPWWVLVSWLSTCSNGRRASSAPPSECRCRCLRWRCSRQPPTTRAAHRDAAAVGRELHGVGQQIEHDLLERAAVGAQHGSTARSRH